MMQDRRIEKNFDFRDHHLVIHHLVGHLLLLINLLLHLCLLRHLADHLVRMARDLGIWDRPGHHLIFQAILQAHLGHQVHLDLHLLGHRGQDHLGHQP